MRLFIALLVWVGLLCAAACAASGLPTLGTVADFSLTDQSGHAVTLADLKGRPWIADFVYTTCPGPCPVLSRELRTLSRSLPSRLQVVSFTVDPATDTPAVLARYAADLQADPQRWHFLTGPADVLDTLLVGSFHVPVDRSNGAPVHSNHFVLVDADGRIRGYYDGTDDAARARLRQDAMALTAGNLAGLPAVDACLNALSAILVLAGFVAIRNRQVALHKLCMLSAFVSSCFFLTGYLAWHARVGTIYFPGTGLARALYLSILGTHTVLAAATVPLVFTTLSRALRGNFDRHVRIARVTFPVWLYVSVTGVVVYLMLY